MLNIKEIALRVAQAINLHYIVTGEMHTNDDWNIRFAEALIAELAKQNEPVACRYKDHNGHWCFMDKQYGNNEPLYTYPPTAEQIANETAEAIAAYITSGRYMVLNPGVLISAEQHTQYLKNHDIYQANAIRRGAWKEFK